MIHKKLCGYLAIFCIFLLTTSCFDFLTNSKGTRYEGITVTNEMNEILSVDPDDWGCSSPIIPTDSTSGLPSSFCFGTAYPNPASDEAIIPFTIPERSYVKIWVKNNSDFSIVLHSDTMSPGNYNLGWDCSKVSSGIYRIFIETSSWHEHGDILVQ